MQRPGPPLRSAMLRKLLGTDTETLTAAEEVAVGRLAAAHRRLVVEGGRVNTKSEAGFNACALFLEGLDSAARALRLDPAPRSYRTAFTINYRALFPDEARNYRVDVLEASVEQYAVIWVNGDKFEFSAEAMRRAEALQKACSELGVLLQRWVQVSEQQPRGAAAASGRPARAELWGALVSLDCAWASFEHKYIAELIEIEEKARRLVVQAIEQERGLQLLEARYGKGESLERLPEYVEKQKGLVACIAKLNSVANFRRKGRDDLSAQVLHHAVNTLKRCDGAERAGQKVEALEAARVLAKDVVESFMAIRQYLREVERCLERVDPHLCNNAGLVARLVDWEESWEVGTRYVQNERLLGSVCGLVAEIRAAQRVVPALTQMCEDCDVELFLVLPRIIWLRFLARPAQNTELLQSLLPHRFVGAKGSGAHDAELQVFVEKFQDTQRRLIAAQPGGLLSLSTMDAEETVAWNILVKMVVSGPGGREEALQDLGRPSARHGPVLAEAHAATEDLMQELEKWSIELQRHCPEDWNQCSAILVQCLSGGGPRQQQEPSAFKV